MSAEMRGPRGVRHAAAEFARAHLPAHLAGCETAWGLKAGSLPAPKSAPGDPRADAYVAHEPDALDRWPLLAVTSGPRTQRGTDTDDDGSPVFRATYAMRMWTWVRAAGRGEAQDLRDDYATAIGVLLLAHTALGTDGRLLLDPRTLRTEFSRVEGVKGDRFVAGSYVAFDLHATETLTDRLAMPGQQPRDTVARVTATGFALPYPVED